MDWFLYDNGLRLEELRGRLQILLLILSEFKQLN